MRFVLHRQEHGNIEPATVIIDAEPAGFWGLTRLHITGGSVTKSYHATIFKAWRGPVTESLLTINAQHVLGTHLRSSK